MAYSFFDDFDGPAGSLPDPNFWKFQIGPHSTELQTYDDQHARLDGQGRLAITAEKKPTVGPDGKTYQYVSSMITTAGKVEPQYGVIEASIQMPKGRGLWPAFWLVGNDHDTPAGGWPRCGEIDVTEVLGHDVLTTYGTLHGPLVSAPTSQYSKGTVNRTLPVPGRDLSQGFHIYSVKWEPLQVTFAIDGVAAWPVFKNTLTADQNWVYDHPFWMILNLAVGGSWPGAPDANTVFPATMLVDWVRVAPLP